MATLFCFGLSYTASHYIAAHHGRFDRVFATVEEFSRVWLKETMFRDPDLLRPDMGQFQQYYGRLFVHQGLEQGWQLIRGVKL